MSVKEAIKKIFKRKTGITEAEKARIAKEFLDEQKKRKRKAFKRGTVVGGTAGAGAGIGLTASKKTESPDVKEESSLDEVRKIFKRKGV